MTPVQSPTGPVGYLVPPSSPVLQYVPSPNVKASAVKPVSPDTARKSKGALPQSSSAALIPSAPLQPSVTAPVSAVPEPPVIVMPPGMKPPPPHENGILNPASFQGARRLQIPANRENSRQTGYQNGYKGYIGIDADKRQPSSQSYTNSQYSNIQRKLGYSSYPVNSYPYQTTSFGSTSLQRSYRHIQDKSQRQVQKED